MAARITPAENARKILDNLDSSECLPLSKVLELFQSTRSSLYRWINLGEFPKPSHKERHAVWSVRDLRQVLYKHAKDAPAIYMEEIVLLPDAYHALKKLGGGSVQLAINRITTKLLTKE